MPISQLREASRGCGCRRSIGCAQACSTLHEWRGFPPIGRSANTPKTFGRYRLKAEKFFQAIAAKGPSQLESFGRPACRLERHGEWLVSLHLALLWGQVLRISRCRSACPSCLVRAQLSRTGARSDARSAPVCYCAGGFFGCCCWSQLSISRRAKPSAACFVPQN
jgi:hypothetical protein